MAGEVRKDMILERLERDRKVHITALAAEFGVSDETIRRDLRALEAGGAVRRVYGGAIASRQSADTPITERALLNALAKDRIAARARSLIADGSTIFLDTGTTTLALARRLTGLQHVKLYTNSVLVAQAACAQFGLEVRMTPGRLRSVEQDLVGHDTLAYIRQFRFDVAFMGVAAVSPELGFMDIEADEARVRQTLLECSVRGVMLADASKFGRPGNVVTAGFDRPSALVTNRRPSAEFLDIARRAGLEVFHG